MRTQGNLILILSSKAHKTIHKSFVLTNSFNNVLFSYSICRVFTRPYPQATAGTPDSLQFDFDTRIFRYTFETNTAIPSPTEIFVPPLIYPEGFDVIVSSALEWEQEGNKIIVRANEDTLSFVHIMPKGRRWPR